MDEEELMTGIKKTDKQRQDDAESNHRWQQYGETEWLPFLKRYDNSDDPEKYYEGHLRAAWIQHCNDLENGVAEPLSRQGLTCGKWNNDTKQWQTDTPIQRPKHDSEKATLTAGTFNRDTQEWETEKQIEKDSESGLTCGKWNSTKKVWETDK